MRQVKSSWEFGEQDADADLHFPDTSTETPDRRKRKRRSWWPASRARGTRRFPFNAVLVGLFAGLCGAVTVSIWLDDRPVSEVVRSHLSNFDALAELAGFGIEQVSVSGHRYTTDAAIFEALALKSGRSFLSYDTLQARQRLEALPWIGHAALTRVFPGQLDVRVSERQAFGLWQRREGLYLIDRQGRVLGATDARAAPRLPLVEGDGAAEFASDLLKMVRVHNDLAVRFVKAERVAKRRWRLILSGNVRLELPADNAAQALSVYAANAGPLGLKEVSRSVIDLRVQGRIIVRPDGGVAENDPAPKSIEDLVRRSG